jgi:Flp pilus assembly protein TadB
MIGVGLALVIVGIVFLFFIPWVGIPVGIVGIVLLVAFLAGFGRHPRDRRTLTDDQV